MFHKLPTDCVLAVTGRCNSHCLMCDIWKTQDSAELPAVEYGKLPSRLRDINISGGEPFLRPDLAEVIRVVAATCPKARIVISTNGLATNLITEKFKEILLIKPDIGAAISIDGIGERHDEIRGVPGGFDKALATVRALKGLGMNNLRLAFTLLEKNINQLSKVYDLSRELGVEFTHTYAQSSEIYFGGKNNEELLLSEENDGIAAPPARARNDTANPRLSSLKKEYDYLIKNELKTWNVKRWLRAYYAYGMYKFIIDCQQILSSAPGRDFFFMNQKGDIYPSVAHNVVMGNILDFKNFWHSAETEKKRRRADAMNIPLWMVCTARTAMRKHPLQVGAWILWRNMFRFCRAITVILAGLLAALVLLAPASAAPLLANYYLNVLPADGASVVQLAKYDILIITPSQAAKHQNVIENIKKRHPDIIILAYLPTQSYNQKYWPDDPIFRDLRVKEEWWLKDSQGRIVSHWSDLLDINLRADYAEYLTRFADERVLAIPGVDGLFLDMIFDSISWVGNDLDLNGDGLPDAPAEADREWRKRVEYFLRYAAEHSRAKYLIINGSSHPLYQPLVNGRMFENFPTPWEGDGRWSTSMNNLVKNHAANRLPRLTIINSNSGNTGNQSDYRSMRFGLASSLLEDDVFYSFDYGDQNHGQLWRYDEYEIDLGKATGEAASPDGRPRYSEGVWHRDYERGLVIVNSGSEPREVNLGGEYEKIIGKQDPRVNDGSITDRARLPAQDGLIVLKTFHTIKEAVFSNGSFLHFFDQRGRRARNGFFAYEEGMPGGTQIYHGDLDNDGREDKILVDGLRMEIFNNNGERWFKDYLELKDFRGNISLAVGKLSPGGQNQLLLAPSVGGRIVLLNYHGVSMRDGFFPLGKNYQGGLAVAIGNVDGGGDGEAIIGTGGKGRAAQILIYDSRLEKLKAKFYPLGKKFFGEIKVAAGDLDADGLDEIVVSAARGKKSEMLMFEFSGKQISRFSVSAGLGGAPAVLACQDVNFDGADDIILASR